jgi:feruloyl esterase
VRGVLAAAGLAALSAAPAPGTPQPPACAALAGVRIAPAAIGLPTRGGEVTEAPDGRRLRRLAPAYCRVRARIRPIDRSAPDIRFELDLPEAWNGKALMVGGGGFDGVIPDTAGPLLDQPSPRILGPLARGYAVFGGDSGHQAANPDAPTPAVDGAFALNDEAFANYAGDAVKKTRDAAVALIVRHAGHGPTRTYVAGGSNGGREALLAIARWPSDFDGAIAAFPFRDAGTTALAFGAVYRAFAQPGAYPNPSKRALVQAAAVSACDGLDGLQDGLVANVEACRFDPARLRCPGGAEAGDDCLSDPQIAALMTFARPFAFPDGPAGRPAHLSRLHRPRRWPAQRRAAGLGRARVATPRGHAAGRMVLGPAGRFAVARDAAFDPGRWIRRARALRATAGRRREPPRRRRHALCSGSGPAAASSSSITGLPIPW